MNNCQYSLKRAGIKGGRGEIIDIIYGKIDIIFRLGCLVIEDK